MKRKVTKKTATAKGKTTRTAKMTAKPVRKGALGNNSIKLSAKLQEGLKVKAKEAGVRFNTFINQNLEKIAGL